MGKQLLFLFEMTSISASAEELADAMLPWDYLGVSALRPELKFFVGVFVLHSHVILRTNQHVTLTESLTAHRGSDGLQRKERHPWMLGRRWEDAV
ncbi:hypothetical protein V8C35DRAFT_288585 [Trichoderma chlorosporum]